MNTTTIRLGLTALVLVFAPAMTTAQYNWVNDPNNPLRGGLAPPFGAALLSQAFETWDGASLVPSTVICRLT